MKRSIFVFLFSVLLALLAVPAINIIVAPSRDAIKLKEKSFLYNVDFVSRWAATLLYPLGISTDPKQVIVGKDGWLYLGDMYQQTISDDRRPATENDTLIGKQIGAATEAWDAYLAGKGVKLFRIMVGPNKGTIYPEHMPSWAKPAVSNPTDALLAETGGEHYIDLRPPLLAARETQDAALYYKTDTHWNDLGAGIAFRAFAQQVGKAAPELQWPSEKTYEVARVDPRKGGDLANFLRLTASLTDYEPITRASSLSVETTESDFDTKKVLRHGGNPVVGSPMTPLLVTSVGALNNKKVLWLRDSFGNSLSPLMAATFSDVLQLHWSEAIKPGGRFSQLVEEFKPDYVFVTVVERSARTPSFAAYPPPAFFPKGKDFQAVRTVAPVRSNNLIPGPSESEYQINGNDAFVDFALLDSATQSNAQYLNIGLTCADGSPSVPLQLFWLEDGQSGYDEEHSARFSIRTGQTLIDLRTLPKWRSVASIKRVRVDIDSVGSCTRFKLNNPSFGVKTSSL
ncbi:alginate O-acetyltransferase AlgX-related protein [Pseudomonas sp. 18173]|uniref:alginate O-acetyltransferase AlgX-related protein n=1 Tax=Pseudomonas sp. 18173 TaxID=3390055 RepID=UPI003D2590C7